MDLAGSLKTREHFRYFAEVFPAMTSLQHLILDENHLDKDDLADLLNPLKSSVLLMLSLSDNDLGDDGVLILAKHLHKFPVLQTLGLDNVNLTATGVKAVVEACPHITNLSMSDNHIGTTISIASRMTVSFFLACF